VQRRHLDTVTINPSDRGRALVDFAKSRIQEPGLRLALGTAIAGCAPFVAGYLLSRSGRASTVARAVKCPLLTLTGYPCPSCGGTRAFASVAAGDGRWRDYNAPLVWYAVALIASAIGLAAMPRQRRNAIATMLSARQATLRAHPVATLAACLVVAIPPWRASLAADDREDPR